MYLAPKYLLTQKPIYCNLISVFSKFLTSRSPLQFKKIIKPQRFFLIWLYLLAFIKLEIKIKRHLIHSNMQTFQNLLSKDFISCCAESKSVLCTFF